MAKTAVGGLELGNGKHHRKQKGAPDLHLMVGVQVGGLWATLLFELSVALWANLRVEGIVELHNASHVVHADIDLLLHEIEKVRRALPRASSGLSIAHRSGLLLLSGCVVVLTIVGRCAVVLSHSVLCEG